MILFMDQAKQEGFQAVMVEPRKEGIEDEGMLTEGLPILGVAARRIGQDGEEGGWSGRRVEVRRVLGRWFRFEEGPWERDRKLDGS